MTAAIDLKKHGIDIPKVLRNPPPSMLYEEGLRREKGTAISATGALIAYSGAKTGRSPTDKRVVADPQSQDDIWWGKVNIKLDDAVFEINRERALDYLNTRDQLFVVDGFAGWDERYRLKVRIICERAYHALFMRNMLIRPTPEELESFGEPDFVVYNAGRFPANSHTAGMTSKTSVTVSFERKELVILGTEYAGEMKKGVFTIMNYLMPKQGVLSMHCSANEGENEDDVSIFFGLSGTGKTTLSADPHRKLIGDDEHCWTDATASSTSRVAATPSASTCRAMPSRRSTTRSATARCSRTSSTTRRVGRSTTPARSTRRTPGARTRSSSFRTRRCRRSPSSRRTSSS